MARYKYIDTQPKFLPVDLAQQLATYSHDPDRNSYPDRQCAPWLTSHRPHASLDERPSLVAV